MTSTTPLVLTRKLLPLPLILRCLTDDASGGSAFQPELFPARQKAAGPIGAATERCSKTFNDGLPPARAARLEHANLCLFVK